MSGNQWLAGFRDARNIVRSVNAQMHGARTSEQCACGALNVQEPLVMRAVASDLTGCQESSGQRRERAWMRQCL
jgi:hypothetical protein